MWLTPRLADAESVHYASRAQAAELESIDALLLGGGPTANDEDTLAAELAELERDEDLPGKLHREVLTQRLRISK